MFPRSYAVLWQEGEGPVSAGELVLGPSSLSLETGASGRHRLSTRVLRYRDLAAIAKAAPSERILGRPTALLESRARDRVAIATLEGPGSAHELVDRLSFLLVRG